jgi:beta-lactamase regulating signal transducer with metallopeptidase domain
VAPAVYQATQLAGLADVGIGISRNLTAAAVLLGVWLCGAALMFARLLVRLHAARRDEGTARGCNTAPLERRFPAHGVPVTLSAAGQGPSVDGVLRPYISLPLGIDRLLTDRELDAGTSASLSAAACAWGGEPCADRDLRCRAAGVRG